MTTEAKTRQREKSSTDSVHLAVSGLKMRYAKGGAWAVDDISFDVKRGEFFALLGPSGSGKTSTLNVIAGFLRPDEGNLSLNGRSLMDIPPHRRGTAMVFQDYALFPHMTVTENIAYGLKLRKVKGERLEARVNELLDLVEMHAQKDRLPSQLSGGQRQRVAVARALAIDPEIVLLDEPLSNLDEQLRRRMRRDLQRILRAAGVTVILVTHDQHEAFGLCDRVAVMFDGHIHQISSPSELYLRPQNWAVANFIGDANFVPATLDRVGESGDAKLILETPKGKVPVRGVVSNPISVAGDSGHLMLRPEAVRFCVDEDGTPVFEGEIIAIDFLGETVRYVVAASGLQLVVSKFSHQGVLELGSSVGITWNHGDGIFLSSKAGADQDGGDQ